MIWLRIFKPALTSCSYSAYLANVSKKNVLNAGEKAADNIPYAQVRVRLTTVNKLIASTASSLAVGLKWICESIATTLQKVQAINDTPKNRRSSLIFMG